MTAIDLLMAATLPAISICSTETESSAGPAWVG